MSAERKQTFSPHARQPGFLDDRIARDAAVGAWLFDEVAPIVDAMRADPTRGISIDKVTRRIRARHGKHLNARPGA